MRGLLTAVLVIALAMGYAAGVEAGPGKEQPAKPAKVKIHARGEAFCPTAALIVGHLIISSGRCYTVYVLRDARGTFLAFADPSQRIPPGQIVRLRTPAGAKLRGRIFYLVPLRPPVAIVPLDSVMLVGFRTEDSGPRLTMTITGVPASNVFVTFQVRF